MTTMTTNYHDENNGDDGESSTLSLTYSMSTTASSVADDDEFSFADMMQVLDAHDDGKHLLRKRRSTSDETSASGAESLACSTTGHDVVVAQATTDNESIALHGADNLHEQKEAKQHCPSLSSVDASNDDDKSSLPLTMMHSNKVRDDELDQLEELCQTSPWMVCLVDAIKNLTSLERYY
ncbi:hypothetical protein MPSEU_000053900 [Mayamaea pseudoterrestris]|nr:hypothetical protein MPSEU_000053900 [Mayamaea pseudoterrestris]